MHHCIESVDILSKKKGTAVIIGVIWQLSLTILSSVPLTPKQSPPAALHTHGALSATMRFPQSLADSDFGERLWGDRGPLPSNSTAWAESTIDKESDWGWLGLRQYAYFSISLLKLGSPPAPTFETPEIKGKTPVIQIQVAHSALLLFHILLVAESPHSRNHALPCCTCPCLHV